MAAEHLHPSLEEVGPFHFSESFHFIRQERLVAALD